LKDQRDPNRVCGAVGFSVRENVFYVFKAKVVYCGMGGAVHVFRPRSQGEGLGRSWYAVFNAGTTYALSLLAGAEMTQMDLRFVPPRFKDSYGPVGTFFLLFKTPATNAHGGDYIAERAHELEKYAPYGKTKPYPTCLRNHLMLLDMKEGKGPILMHHEKVAEKIRQENPDPKEQKKKLREFESEAWEDFLDMTITGATNWAAHNIDPVEKPMELTTSEPVFIGSHSGGTGAWCCGPEDLMPDEYKDAFPAQYNTMTTVMGLFTAGDGVGASGHKFSSGSFTQGRIAGKAMVKFVRDNGDYVPEVSEETINRLKEEVYRPIVLYEKHSKYTVTPEINPYYISPNMFMFRLQKIMDEYAGGWATGYETSDTLLETALWKLEFCREDIPKIAASNLHELLRAWENIHRYWVAEMHVRALLARKDTRYPGYYYKLDYPELREDLKKFYNLKYDSTSGEWSIIERPMISIVD
jgi:adenylylsulfate reductase subunit A